MKEKQQELFHRHSLPPAEEMYEAFVNRDPSYEGVFWTGVTTTGIFCRPECSARKPKRENVVFFASRREALENGYRPCKICKPMLPKGEHPEWLAALMQEIDGGPVGSPRTHAGTPVITLKRLLTPLGPMLAGSISGGDGGPESGAPRGKAGEKICLLEFVGRRMLETQMGRLRKLTGAAFVPGESALLSRLQTELEEYFAGKRREFTVPLLIAGTPFQQEVWRDLQTIPYGKTRSYGEQAKELGKPEAVRAAARANGDNRISIIIPCHRVIGADGSLTGYGGGIWRKRYLLDLERGRITSS